MYATTDYSYIPKEYHKKTSITINVNIEGSDFYLTPDYTLIEVNDIKDIPYIFINHLDRERSISTLGSSALNTTVYDIVSKTIGCEKFYKLLNENKITVKYNVNYEINNKINIRIYYFIDKDEHIIPININNYSEYKIIDPDELYMNKLYNFDILNLYQNQNIDLKITSEILNNFIKANNISLYNMKSFNYASFELLNENKKLDINELYNNSRMILGFTPFDEYERNFDDHYPTKEALDYTFSSYRINKKTSDFEMYLIKIFRWLGDNYVLANISNYYRYSNENYYTPFGRVCINDKNNPIYKYFNKEINKLYKRDIEINPSINKILRKFYTTDNIPYDSQKPYFYLFAKDFANRIILPSIKYNNYDLIKKFGVTQNNIASIIVKV